MRYFIPWQKKFLAVGKKSAEGDLEDLRGRFTHVSGDGRPGE